jgi:hypothetical protein
MRGHCYFFCQKNLDLFSKKTDIPIGFFISIFFIYVNQKLTQKDREITVDIL